MGITAEKRPEKLQADYRKPGWITERKRIRWSQLKDRKWEKGRRTKNAEETKKSWLKK